MTEPLLTLARIEVIEDEEGKTFSAALHDVPDTGDLVELKAYFDAKASVVYKEIMRRAEEAHGARRKALRDEVIVPMDEDERAAVHTMLDTPTEDFELLAGYLAKDGCRFPQQQAVLMLRNTPGVARKLIAEAREERTELRAEEAEHAEAAADERLDPCGTAEGDALDADDGDLGGV